jgi:SAM-dependent methyltransferase
MNGVVPSIRVDLQLIADMVEPSSSVLDVGCGDGALLQYLWKTKGVDGRGIELSQAGVNASVRNGLSRMSLAWSGRMPVTENLPHQWYDTPNIHFCTIRDFVTLARDMNLHVERGLALNGKGRPMGVNATGALANILAEQAVFLLRRA